LIPAAPGALHDLKDNEDLAVIIKHFVKEKSKYDTLTRMLLGLVVDVYHHF